jgi:hypothetical protein
MSPCSCRAVEAQTGSQARTPLHTSGLTLRRSRCLGIAAQKKAKGPDGLAMTRHGRSLTNGWRAAAAWTWADRHRQIASI